MKKEILKVPRGIRYISEWEASGGYSLNSYPFTHIVNKQITGCGFTEYCLTNNINVIICSPRKVLLENKEDQHQGEVFYFKNEFDNAPYLSVFDQDISTDLDQKAVDKIDRLSQHTESELREIEDRRYYLKRDLLEYMDTRRRNNLPIKILVTYDSFKLVRDFIQNSDNFRISDFYIVIDEFQSIFTDSRFKSDTEIGFLNELTFAGVKKVCFVSATPMLDQYLEMLSEFKDLPYYEFDWKSEDEQRVIKPIITVRSSKSLISDAKAIINSYINGEFESFIYTDILGQLRRIESREAVLYFNSVKNICDLIKKCGLTPENTNVLCSNSLENQKRIKKAFKDSCGSKEGKIGTVPKKGETHKMFTLCTRTVYLGADFYSTSARSFIFSDPNIDCLSVDISLDLPQILGRQRLTINPWKNSATLYYKTIRSNKQLTQATFNQTIREKIEKSNQLIKVVTDLKDESARKYLLDNYEFVAKARRYKYDYVSVNFDYDKQVSVPVFNKLVMVSELRAFDIQQVDYKNRFMVFNSLESSSNSIISEGTDLYLSEFDSLPDFPSKMKYVCNLATNNGLNNISAFLNSIPIKYKNFVISLGPEICESRGYRKYLLDRELTDALKVQDIKVKDNILSMFEVGKIYPLSEIKDILKGIYTTANLSKTPKAVDLNEYFEVRSTSTYIKIDGEKKYVRALEILSIKP